MRGNRATEPPDGGYGWVVLVSCAICLSTIVAMARTLGLVLVELIDIYDVNRTQAFLVVVMMRIFAFAFAPLVGKLLTKFDYCVILCCGSLFLSFSFILTSCTTAYWQVLITYGCLQGIGSNCVMATSTLTVGLYFKKRRSLALGILYAAGGVNGFASPILFNWLLETYHFHGALLIMGGLALNSCAFGMLVRQPTWTKKEPQEQLLEMMEFKIREENSNSSPASQTNGVCKVQNNKLKTSNLKEEEMRQLCTEFSAEDKPKVKKSRLKSIFREIQHDLRLFKDGLFLLHVFNRTFVMITFAYFLSIVPDFVEVEIKPAITKKEVAFVLSMASIGDIIVRFATGTILDKLPWAKKHTLGGVSFCMGLTVLLFQFSQTYTHLVIGSVCFGLCLGMNMVVQFAVEMELMGPKRVHMANGLTRFVAGSASAVAGVLIGYLRDSLGSYKVCLTLLGASAILGGLVWLAEPLVSKCCPPENLKRSAMATEKIPENS